MKAKLVNEKKPVLKGRYNTKPINEGFATESSNQLDRIYGLIGYDDYYDFISDNPGVVSVIIDWIDENFAEQLSNELERTELDELGLYRSADILRDKEDN